MRTLLLNTSGEFLGVTNWQNAIGDLVVGNVVALRNYEKTVRSQYLDVQVPAVVQQVKYIHAKWDHIFRITHSPKNIFIRDHYVCQYCGYECSRDRYTQKQLQKKPKLYLTLPEMDHVIPSSKGGANSWENTVCSCRRCNNSKDDRTPAQAGMKLASAPARPKGFKEIFEMKVGQVHHLWHDYLKIYF
jgi:5-methylcytosine-specific restriction endonuclease McrA